MPARGEPLVDLAWFEGQPARRRGDGGPSTAVARRAPSGRCSRATRPCPSSRIRHRLAAFTGAALLRRAVEPFRLRVARWPEAQAALLSEAEAKAAAGAEVAALS